METIKCNNNYGKPVELPKEKFQPRPSVYAILRNGNKILTCKNKSNSKLWFPGGGIEKNETPKQALLRERLEETGITDIKIHNLMGVFHNYFYYEPTDEAMDATLHFFECSTSEVIVKSNEQVDDDEAFNFTWMTIDQISQDNICDLQEEIYNLLSSLK